MLEQWRLWDHIDAILSLAVTQLVDRILGVSRPGTRPPATRPLPVDQLDAAQVRDVLLLAACYDQSTAENAVPALARLAAEAAVLAPGGRNGTWPWAFSVTVAVIGLFAWFRHWTWFGQPWPYLAIAAGWAPRVWRLLRWWWRARQITRNTRVLNRSTKLLCRTLLNFPGGQIVGQPLPAWQRTDDRYELLGKLQGVLRSMHFDGILVLVDRVDEPYLINGSTELMRALVWPMLDNKFLKHRGLGLKLLLPIELERLLDRESRDFHQRARLDKQNLIRSLELDRANRSTTWPTPGSPPAPPGAFAEDRRPVRGRRPAAADRRLRRAARAAAPVQVHVPAVHAHCNAHTEEQPAWKISASTFESVLALYRRITTRSTRGTGRGRRMFRQQTIAGNRQA